jgi:hypothetical protein
MGAQQFLGLHRQEVAVEHRRRLDEDLADRQRRKLDRVPARLPHAALDALGALAKVRVARRQVAPRVDDRNDRLAHEVGAPHAHLLRSLAVAERAHVVGGEPALAAQGLEGAAAFGGHRGIAGSRRRGRKAVRPLSRIAAQVAAIGSRLPARYSRAFRRT